MLLSWSAVVSVSGGAYAEEYLSYIQTNNSVSRELIVRASQANTEHRAVSASLKACGGAEIDEESGLTVLIRLSGAKTDRIGVSLPHVQRAA